MSKKNATNGAGTAVATAPAETTAPTPVKRKNADAVGFKRFCDVFIKACVLGNKNAAECAAELGMDIKNFNQRQTSARKDIRANYPEVVKLMTEAGNPKMYLKSNRGGKIDPKEKNDFLTQLIGAAVASKTETASA